MLVHEISVAVGCRKSGRFNDFELVVLKRRKIAAVVRPDVDKRVIKIKHAFVRRNIGDDFVAEIDVVLRFDVAKAGAVREIIKRAVGKCQIYDFFTVGKRRGVNKMLAACRENFVFVLVVNRDDVVPNRHERRIIEIKIFVYVGGNNGVFARIGGVRKRNRARKTAENRKPRGCNNKKYNKV